MIYYYTSMILSLHLRLRVGRVGGGDGGVGGGWAAWMAFAALILDDLGLVGWSGCGGCFFPDPRLGLSLTSWECSPSFV